MQSALVDRAGYQEDVFVIEQSDTITDLAAALSKAQGEVEGAKKDSANPHFKSKYADLESVWAACRDALTGNGLAVLQSPGLTVDGVMHMTTQLTHSSGQWIRGEMSLPLSKVDPQGAGSALTYMRRYALSAFVGVAPEDDDGNAAARPGQGAVSNNRPAAPQRQAPAPLTGKAYRTRAEARAGYGESVRQLHACGDSDQLEAYLATDAKDAIEQFQAELPDAWNGDGADFIGMKAEIENARKRVIDDSVPY